MSAVRRAAEPGRPSAAEGDGVTDVEIRVRPTLTDGQLNALFAAAWPAHAHRAWGPVLARSAAYVGAFHADRLIGFVNVAGDGGAHAFLLDPTVHPAHRRQGVGLALVRRAAVLARAAGAEWLHVDYEPRLAAFYAAAGFRPSAAGVLRLSEPPAADRVPPPVVASQPTRPRTRPR
jgi:GNAT superfamily N-acetyltransferase